MTLPCLFLKLQTFSATERFKGKGPLCVALVVTEHARELGLPLDPDKLLTLGGGQIVGLGKAKVQEVLKRHNIDRILAEEGGRTSRGSIGKMRAYVDFLNALAIQPDFDLNVVELFWVERVRDFFLGKPFALVFESGANLRSVVGSLLSQAGKRQKDMPGTTFVGTMMQHLVGAKLEIIFGGGIQHESASASDESTSRGGDFLIEDAVIHVTNTPTEALIRKCKANLENGLRPLVITTRQGATLAELNAHQFEIFDRIEIIEIEQWIASNVLEWAGFKSSERRSKIIEMIDAYNRIVDQVESDPSLRIEAVSSRG